MIELRPLTLLVVMVVPACSTGVAGVMFTANSYEKKLQRISEERQVYMSLANQAVKMSEKAFSFTLENQETLSICMSRLYAPRTVVPAMATKKVPTQKGGIGGPDTMRGDSRLP